MKIFKYSTGPALRTFGPCLGLAVLAFGIFVLTRDFGKEVSVFKKQYMQISNGMTRDAVESILGKPHGISDEIPEGDAGPSSQCVLSELFVRDGAELAEGVDVIIVYFDKHGLVVGKRISEFSH
jgi:hypothetical protein